MTRADKIEHLQKKTQDLIAWFEDVPPPAVPFKIKPWATITHLELYIDTQVARMMAHWQNPFNTLFVNAYRSIDELKTYIENARQNIEAGGIASTMPEPVNPGNDGPAGTVLVQQGGKPGGTKQRRRKP